MPPTSSPKIPKYVQLADDLKSQIEQKVFKPGDRLPSFVEMRAQHGVMPATVERIYGRLEQEKLVVREQGRGTFVAQPQTRTATGIIGFSGMASNRQAHPYWLRLLGGMREVATEAGLEILLLKEVSVIDFDKVDGVIVHETKAASAAEMLHRLPSGMPIVGLMMPLPHQANVVVDDYQGVYDLTKYVASLGHRRIAYIVDPVLPRRELGYRDALREMGVEPDARWIRSIEDENKDRDPDYASLGYEAMSNWLQQDWNDLGCTVVLTQNDDTALGVIGALREAGIRVPEEVGVVGFDGTELRHYFSPPLTSVQVPLHEVGATAMQQLLRQMRGEKVHASTTVLPTQLLIGRSVLPIQEMINKPETYAVSSPGVLSGRSQLEASAIGS